MKRVTYLLLCLLVQAHLCIVGSRRYRRVYEKNLLAAPASPGMTKYAFDNSTQISTMCKVKLPSKCNCSRSEIYLSITCANLELTSVPQLIVGTYVVKTLNLEHNQLKSIKIGSFFGVKIERLLLSQNSLSSLSFLAFWGLEYNLATLDLSYNYFTKVPSSPLRLLRHLRSLSLKGNKITELQDFDFGFLRKLEILSLDNNPIVNIAPRTFDGTQLSLLILNSIDLHDGLESFPSGDLKQLKGLSLANNGLSVIPDGWFSNFKSLRYLSLDSNIFTNLAEDAFYGLHNTLETLEMNSNRFHRIPKATLRNLLYLKTLEMTHNRIHKIYPKTFNCSSRLQSLDLSYNVINKISIWAFDGMDTTQKIDLRNNELTTLDDRTLYWADPIGREILLSGNPWLCNCLLKWIKREHKKKTELSSMFTDGLDMLCNRPYFLDGKPVIRIHLKDFTCDHDYYYYYAVDESEADGDDLDEEDEYKYDDEDYNYDYDDNENYDDDDDDVSYYYDIDHGSSDQH